MNMRFLLLTLLAVVPLNFAYAEHKAVDDLNELLKGELSAIETYRQALDKVKDQPDSKELYNVLDNHKKAAQVFTAHVKELGGTPSTDSGAWGTWAKTVTGTAKIFGDAAALKALKEGEEHGLKEYKELLEDEDVPQKIKEEVKNKYIPTQEAHIKLLNQFIDKA